MTNRKCPVCGGKKADSLKEIVMKIPKDYHLPQSYNVVACDMCGFVYADTSASMDDYDWYYSHCNFYGDDSKDDNTYRYEMVQEFVGKYCSKDARMLDIGAGNGRFEIALKKNGYKNVVGMDPSEISVKRLRSNDVEAYIGSIYSDILPEEEHQYDAVFLFEVAEHLLCPGLGMQKVRKLLKESGYFIISVPDYSLIAEDTSDIPNYFNLEHINYFSEVSLDNLMLEQGMTCVVRKHAGNDLICCYKCEMDVTSMKKDTATRQAITSYFATKQEKEERVRALIDELSGINQEIVIWGTGSYVMSLIATTDLLDCNIIGFIDNNKIKQGREMYGHTIYAPEFLLGKHVTV